MLSKFKLSHNGDIAEKLPHSDDVGIRIITLQMHFPVAFINPNFIPFSPQCQFPKKKATYFCELSDVFEENDQLEIANDVVLSIRGNTVRF